MVITQRVLLISCIKRLPILVTAVILRLVIFNFPAIEAIPFFVNFNSMKKSYIPLIIITGLMIHSLYQVGTSNKAFSYPHYLGLILILISLVFLIFNIIISKLATFLALLLGTFSQAAFTTTIYRYRIGGTIEGRGFDILIQPLCWALLILFIVLNISFLKWGIGEIREFFNKE